MTTIKLDNIPVYQDKITFHNDRLQTMLSNVKQYANVQITYNDFSKRIEREGFTFTNEKGRGVGRILVSDRKGEERYMFIY